jgi:hypothetical protein
MIVIKGNIMKLFNVIRIEPDGVKWPLAREVSESEAKRQMFEQEFFSKFLKPGTKHFIEEVVK